MRRHPDRFIGLGCVPLQDVDMAIRELEYVMRDLKFAGIEIEKKQKDGMFLVTGDTVVGIFPDYASAEKAWRGAAQRTVDDAEMKYVVVHLHRLLEPDMEA